MLNGLINLNWGRSRFQPHFRHWKTIRHFIIPITTVFIVISCAQKEVETIETQILIPEKVFDDFGEGVFFNSVSFTSNEDRIFIINKNPASLFILDKSFNLQKLIERRGNGPEELSFPNQIISTKHGLMIEDLGNQKVALLHPETGEYLTDIKIPEPVSQWRFFFDGDKSLYFSINAYQSDSLSVLKINTRGEVEGKFGVLMPQEKGSYNRQARIIQPFEEKEFILIGINLPFIDILRSNGEKTSTHQWDRFEPLKRALDSLESDFQKPNFERNPKEIKHVIIDAQYDDGKLYVSFTDRIGMDRSKTRHLLEFVISKRQLELSRVFRFETGTADDNLHPNTFLVDSKAGKIYTQGLITKKIYVFDLPDLIIK